MEEDRPPASDWHEELALMMFSEGQSPEEFAARHAPDILLFSFHNYRYRDEQIDAWIQRLGEILGNTALVHHFQETLLTPDELAAVRQRETEEF